MIIHDGQILWHDLDDRLSSGLFETIRIQEMKYLRDSLMSDVISRIQKYDSFDDFDIIRENGQIDRADVLWLKQQQPLGFLISGWKAYNMDNSYDALYNAVNADEDFLSQFTAKSVPILCPRLFAYPGNQPEYTHSENLYGRCLIYRQGKFLVVLILEYFDDADGPDFIRSLGNDNLPSPTSPSSSSQDTSIAVHRFLSLCANIQQGLVLELEHFEKNLRASSNSSSLNLSEIKDKEVNMQRNHSSAGWNIPKYSRVLYCNRILRSLQLSTWCAHTVDPLLLWPTLLINPYSSLKQYQQSSMNIVASRLIELSSDVRGQYMLPAALLTASIEPYIIKALNYVHHQLSNKSREACIRLKSGNRGGVWMYGRRMNDRFVYIVLERCDTMNEMQELVEQIIRETFQHILI